MRRPLGKWALLALISVTVLVADQVRRGVAHPPGDALFEHCIYDQQGQLVTTTMLAYLVPMAGESPDITLTSTPWSYR